MAFPRFIFLIGVFLLEQDLTRGSVPRSLIQFALPILGANLLQALYNLVDMAVVGRLVGSAGLTAVSSAAQLCYIINALCTGVTMGGSVLVSQYRGAGDEAHVRKTVSALFVLAGLCALLLTAVGALACRPVFVLMNVPTESVAYAEGYMRTICMGTVFVFGYNAACAVLRGLGDARGPLYFVAVATAVNLALDLLLVGPLGMGTVGAALATVCAQGISFLVALRALRRRLGLTLRSLLAWPPRDITARILRIGLPTAVQMSVLNLSYLLVTGMLNAYGVAIAAAAGVGLKVNTFAAMPCWAVGSAVTTMAGQCAGARDPARAARACRVGVLLAVGLETVCMFLVLAFAAPMVRFFDPDPAVVAAGVRYLRICCTVNCLVYAAMYVYNAFATGVGAAWFAMVNSILQSVVFRLAFSVLFADIFHMGYLGIFWAECLSPVIPAVLAAVFFRSGIWRGPPRISG